MYAGREGGWEGQREELKRMEAKEAKLVIKDN